jgi:hypothetical protein
MLSVALAVAIGFSLVGFASVVGAQSPSPPRFPDLTKEGMTDAQKRVYDAIAGGTRGGVRGPFAVLLRSPDLADRVQKLGEHLRFNSSLPPRLNEFAILISPCCIASTSWTTRSSSSRCRRWVSRASWI